MLKQHLSKFIGAGTIATIMLILILAFSSFNTGIANTDSGDGGGFFTSVVSSFGEGEDEDEMEEEGEMGEEGEMEGEEEEEDDDDD